ncbi:MAG: divergent PAP2 family protein [Clostridia bacterium]|nr:divergent PAP2 family protein [Clostridia bacterium]
MYTFEAFLSNYPLLTSGAAWAIAQVLKVFTNLVHARKLDLKMLFASGGMPSSHSSTVCALTTACAVEYGFGSVEMAISLILAFIVMHDASGVRWETGEQAKLINKMMQEIFSGEPEAVDTGLKELVGHTPFQVVMGALLGVAIALAMWPLFH